MWLNSKVGEGIFAIGTADLGGKGLPESFCFWVKTFRKKRLWDFRKNPD